MENPDEFNIYYVCEETTTKDYAWEEYISDPTNNGPMNCYCTAMLSSQGIAALDITFGPDEETVCKEWLLSYAKQSAITYGAPFVVLVINEIAAFLFIFLTQFEAPFNYNDLTQSIFTKLLAIQYLNLCIVLSLVNMNLSNTTIEGLAT